MTNFEVFLLALKSIVFIYWAYLMFTTLARLRKRGAEKTGKTFPGPITTLKQFKNFTTSPEDRSDRNRLGLVTLAMIGLNAIFTLMVRLG